MKKFNKTETEIIKNALTEYEENHYTNENKKWQNTINKLIAYFNKLAAEAKQ